MSGKSEGKKRNRAAQSEQHGYQEPPDIEAVKPEAGEEAGARLEGEGEKERVLEKLRRLEEQRRQKEES